MPKKIKDPKKHLVEYPILKSATAAKCGPKSEGLLSYTVSYDPADTSEYYFRITANEGGGLFSDEYVPLSKITSCLQGAPLSGEPFYASLLRQAFNGKSANNHSFLVAVLRAEKLVKPSEENPQLNTWTADLDKWKESLSDTARGKRGAKRKESQKETNKPSEDEGQGLSDVTKPDEDLQEETDKSDSSST